VSNEPKWRAGMRAMVMRALRRYGPQTPQQISARIGQPIEAIAPRMTELEAFGEAWDTGQRRSRLGRGRKQKVWAATEENPA
jgi:predicted ArsR family transcriptional regulator